MGGSSPGPGQVTDSQGTVTSYLVATSPEVLSQLLKENEARGLEFNPALYTTPANALNTSKVDFAPHGHPPPSPYTPRTRARQISQCSASGSLDRSGSGQSVPRSAPGSAQSTLSRAGSGSPHSSLEKRDRPDRGGPGVRRKTSFGASFNSSCQVTLSSLSLHLPCALLIVALLINSPLQLLVLLLILFALLSIDSVALCFNHLVSNSLLTLNFSNQRAQLRLPTF